MTSQQQPTRLTEDVMNRIFWVLVLIGFVGLVASFIGAAVLQVSWDPSEAGNPIEVVPLSAVLFFPLGFTLVLIWENLCARRKKKLEEAGVKEGVCS